MTSPVEEIKARLDIVDFLGTYAQLKRAGANFKANCPFHNEKTPSFMVSRAKQLWYCFGACNEGGDIFKFLMKIEGLEFPEALKILADKAGVELPKYDKQFESRKNTLRAILHDAADFYAEALRNQSGAQAHDYLVKRGLTLEVIKSFGLGYAPDSWEGVIRALHPKYTAEDIFAAGLTIKKERGGGDMQSVASQYYDRFRHRIMFPIRDIHGSTVGFTSRLLDETRQEGKYVNTPETLVYNKGRLLYGLDLAKDAIRRRDYVVLVEGNMDVIACHQFGMANVVAASGTALTTDQVRLLTRYTPNIKMAFDADPAGEHAAKRGIDLALAAGMHVKIISIPKTCGKDPDECIRRDPKTWEAAVRSANEILEFYIGSARAKHDLNTARGQSQFVNEILVEIAKIPDLVEQDFWIKRLISETGVNEKVLRGQFAKYSKGVTAAADIQLPPAAAARVVTRHERLTERLLALFMFEVQCAGEIIANIIPEMLHGEEWRVLYSELTQCYNAFNSTLVAATAAPNFRQFWRNWSQNRDPKILSTGDILELYGDQEFEGWSLRALEKEASLLVSEIRREYTRGRREELAQKMHAAEKAGDRALVEILAREFKQLGD